jgi:hypothetical protein
MPKKLTLSTETLRVLADEELAGVKGAKTGKGPNGCRRTKNTKRTRFKGCNKGR